MSDSPSDMIKAYRSQQRSAHRRGVTWLLTFDAWLRIWRESGHLAHRGRKRGDFCMARHGDVGPYAEWSVSIQPVSVNTSDGQSRGSNVSRIKTQTGRGRGWTFVKGRYYQVMVGATYVGTFKSKELAEAAYKVACVRHVEHLGK